MIRKPISRAAQISLGIASFLVVIGLYSLLSYRQHQENPKDKAIPNFSQFVEGFQRIAEGSDGEMWIWQDATASLVRLTLGMLVGVTLSFLVGIAMGCFTAAEAFLLPPVSFLAKIPPTAMLAVYFVIIGFKEIPVELFGVLGPLRIEPLFVALIALGIFPTLAQAIFQAARKDVTEHAIYKAYTLGASQFEVIWEVVIRQILPRIIENVRLQIGPAMVFLIAAEWVVADIGFGYRLRMESRLTNMNVVYTYLVVLGIAGLVLDWMLSAMRRWWCPWFGE